MWVTTPSSRRSSRLRDQTHVSYVSGIGKWVLDHCCPLGSRINGVCVSVLSSNDSHSHFLLGIHIFVLLISLFFIFGPATWLVGSLFRNQGLKVGHGVKAQNPNQLATGGGLLNGSLMPLSFLAFHHPNPPQSRGNLLTCMCSYPLYGPCQTTSVVSLNTGLGRTSYLRSGFQHLPCAGAEGRGWGWGPRGHKQRPGRAGLLPSALTA